MKILHNPQCSKSRDCLAFTKESNIEFEIIDYLKNPPSVDDLKDLIKKLKIKPIELVRQKEPIWTEKYSEKKMTNAQIIKAMSKYPILIQRPIVIDGERAIIGREIEKLNHFLNEL